MVGNAHIGIDGKTGKVADVKVPAAGFLLESDKRWFHDMLLVPPRHVSCT